jgi:hypothetical protein
VIPKELSRTDLHGNGAHVRVKWLAAVAAALVLVAGCTSRHEPAPSTAGRYDADPKALSIIAGSEQQTVVDISRLVVLQDAGHLCNIEAPLEFNAAVRSFLHDQSD